MHMLFVCSLHISSVDFSPVIMAQKVQLVSASGPTVFVPFADVTDSAQPQKLNVGCVKKAAARFLDVSPWRISVFDASGENFLQETMEPVWTPNWTKGSKKKIMTRRGRQTTNPKLLEHKVNHV